MAKIVEYLKSRKKIIIIGAVTLIIIAIFLLNNPFNKESSPIKVNTFFLKLKIPLGGESETTVKVTNLKEEQVFNAGITNFKDIGFFDQESFSLGAGKSKEIRISFKDNKNEAKIYVGQLVIKSSKSEKTIPIILNVEDRTSEFAIIQQAIQKYEDVYPGGKLGMKIKIYNVENNDLKNVKVSYTVKDLNSEIISLEDENLVVQGNVEINKIIDIPATLSEGNYVFITSIDANGVKTSSGHLFSIVKQGEVSTSSDNFSTFTIVIMVFLIGIVFLFFYFIKTRDDLLVQLKKQQTSELERNLELIESHRRSLSKLKGPRKEKKLKKLKIVRKIVIRRIKAKQHKQIRELGKLKKQGKKGIIAKRMREWENQGYKMFELKKEKAIPKSSIVEQITNWKREGYKTDVLKK